MAEKSAGTLTTRPVSERILFFAEVKQLLSAVQLVLDTNKLDYADHGDDVDVTFTSSQISVRCKSTTVLYRLDHLTLSPVSCNGLICLPNGELQLRMQVSGPNIGCPSKASDKLTHQYRLVDRVSKHYPQCSCATCGQKLLTLDCKFSRVLPLPSENWSELADSWFCHRHDNHVGHTTGALLPKPADCLVGELYILVNMTKLKEDSYLVEDSGWLRCHRCRSQLGELYVGRTHLKDRCMAAGGGVQTSHTVTQPEVVKPPEAVKPPETVKIHFHSITFVEDSSDKVPNKHLSIPSNDRLLYKQEDFLARYLLEQCRIYTSYRFMVQPSINHGNPHHKPSKLCCLVWLLDGDALMYSSEVQIEDRYTEVDIRQTIAVKILYRAYFNPTRHKKEKSDPSDLHSCWKKDRSVHDVDLPHSLYVSFIAALIRNTKHLPSSLRYLNGFHVGYLHKLPASVT